MLKNYFWNPCDLRNPNLSSKNSNLVSPFFQGYYIIKLFPFLCIVQAVDNLAKEEKNLPALERIGNVKQSNFKISR